MGKADMETRSVGLCKLCLKCRVSSQGARNKYATRAEGPPKCCADGSVCWSVMRGTREGSRHQMVMTICSQGALCNAPELSIHVILMPACTQPVPTLTGTRCPVSHTLLPHS